MQSTTVGNIKEKEGYVEASDEYKQKLLDQADKFLKQSKTYKEERNKYEKLLDDCESEINSLTNKLDKTEAENKFLQQLLQRKQKLKEMDS